jgi:hypothetical protein
VSSDNMYVGIRGPKLAVPGPLVSRFS